MYLSTVKAPMQNVNILQQVIAFEVLPVKSKYCSIKCKSTSSIITITISFNTNTVLYSCLISPFGPQTKRFTVEICHWCNC